MEISIERAIEILDLNAFPRCTETEEKEACRMGMEALKRQRWIPCSEKMPKMSKSSIGIEYSETVFALTNGRKIMAAFLRRVPGDKAIWIAPFNFWEAWDEKITHWAEFPPLPEPPEEGEKENE